jgi:hypothetical protein
MASVSLCGEDALSTRVVRSARSGAGDVLLCVVCIITVSVLLSFVFNLFGSFGAVVNLVRDILQGEVVCLEGRVSASSVTEKAKGLGELHGESVEHFSYAISDAAVGGNDPIAVSIFA